MMLTAPIPATEKVLARAGLSIEDIDLIEINEAFASVVLAWEKELHPDMSKVNVNGGAIALGHPVGSSGTRLVLTLLLEMRRRKVSRGLATLCVGGGQGASILLEAA
jgi:acetyl-CoA acetyltransferase